MVNACTAAFAGPVAVRTSGGEHQSLTRHSFRARPVGVYSGPRMAAFRIVDNDGAPTASDEVLVASSRAITPLRPQERDAYTEEQALPSQRRSDLMVPARGGFWSLVPYAAALSTLGFAAWIGYKRMKARQERLVEEYGEVVMYYGTTPESIRQITSEYKRKLGPGVLRGALYGSFLRSLITEKPVGPQSIQDASLVKKLLRIGDTKAVTVVNALGEDLKQSPSLLGKLLFLSERLLSFNEVAQLNLVPLFPYGPGTVLELQRNMVERCFREIVEKEIEEHAAVEPPMETAAMLRLETEEAQTIFEAAVTARETARHKEAESIAAAEAQDALKPQEAELDFPARSGEPAKVAVHAYQCTVCGYTMFPAAGREFKFYGADFVCPACGAPKDKFIDLNAQNEG